MSVISSSPVIRILLMGRNASGESSSGNTLLGENKFKEHESEVCEAQTQIGEKQVYVIDCPDLLDPDVNKEQLEKMKEQLVSRCLVGLSAVLLTVPLEKPVQNEQEILDYITCLFGPEVQTYIMILFTHKDDLEDLDQTIEEYLKHKDHEDLQQLVSECGGKIHCFNNRIKSDDQVQELLQKIEGTMEENRGKFIMKQIKRSGSKANLVNFSAEDPDEADVVPERKDQIRLVLQEETGSGKSDTGNRNLFESSASSNSEIKRISSESSVRMGKERSVIHTHGFIETHSRGLG